MLTVFEKHRLKDFINKRVIDVEELQSYRNHGHNDQNFVRLSEPDDEDWDIDEEYKKQGEEAIELIKNDGLWEWTNIDDKKQSEAIEFIKKETNCEE